MRSLYERLPPLRTLNRTLLLALITVLIWNFDVAWDLLLVTLLNPSHEHAWSELLAPRIVRHLLLLPLLIACYLGSLRMSHWMGGWLKAWSVNLVLGIGFAWLVHPLLFVVRSFMLGDLNGTHTHYAGLLEASLNSETLYYILVNLIIYLLGLFIVMGVNARLDLENERIRTSELHTRWLNARLDTLRGQLNPHFLFNSLHTVSSLLFTDIQRADKLLADFSDVLRITLREGHREFSAVREELDYLRRYLAIEETRFEDRLSTIFDVEEQALDARVPSLIMQPLVENAIKHGISHSRGSNRLMVAARCRKNGMLVLEVSNDYRPGEDELAPERKMGIGLNNVRERLSAIYGSGFTFTSQPLSGGRWSSRIAIPLEDNSAKPRQTRADHATG
jgi:sensor histidine kinase YesM